MKYLFKKSVYRLLMPLFDLAGSIIFFPIKIFKKYPPAEPKAILVVRLDHIGDFICTSPVFKNLKARFPSASITALVNSASKDLALRNPNIDKVITYSPFYLARSGKSSRLEGLSRIIKDVRALKFDLGIDPRGDLISIIIMRLGGVKYIAGYGITGGGFMLNETCKYDDSKHIMDRNVALLEALDIPVSDRSPEVFFSEKDKDEVERLLRRKEVLQHPPRNDGSNNSLAMTEKAVVVHPFAGAKAKEWSGENFQKLIDRLRSDGRNVFLVGSRDDGGAFENVIDLRGKISLPQLSYLVKSAGSFIGLDSGPANIAAALNVPSVIICSGTNVPQLWIPNSSNVKFVCKDVECKPCGLKMCRKEKHECMDSITVEEVFKKFKEIA